MRDDRRTTGDEDDDDEEELDWWDDPNDWSGARDRGEWIDDEDEWDSVVEFPTTSYTWRWRRCDECGGLVVLIDGDHHPEFELPPLCNQCFIERERKANPDALPF